MTRNCMDQINIYFHMKNHYRRLENVKSKINTCSPKGLQKSCAKPNSNHSLKTVNYCERHEMICSYLPHHYSRKYGNFKSTTEPNLKSFKPSFSSTKKSLGRRASQKCSANTKKHTENDKLTSSRKLDNHVYSNEKTINVDIVPEKQTEDSHLEKCDESEAYDKKNFDCIDDQTESKIGEHEYIQFLLRIIEDILLNNYRNSEDIFQVFQRHIEANEGRLNRDKMCEHIERLATELQMSEKLRDSLKIKSVNLKMKNFNYTKHVSDKFLVNFDVHLQGNCECSVQRILKVDKNAQKEIDACENNVTEIIEKNHLLLEGRAPENSLETIYVDSLKLMPGTMPSNYGKMFDETNFSVNCCDDNEIPATSNTFTEDIPVQKEAVILDEDFLVARKSSNSQEMVFIIQNNIKDIESTSVINVEAQENKLGIQDNPDEMLKANQEIEHRILATNDKKSNPNTTSSNTEKTSVSDSIDKDKILYTKSTSDSSTQTEVHYTDKECNTKTENAGDLMTEDYIPINGPIYVPRKALNLEGKIMFSNSLHKGVDYVPAKENPPENNLICINAENLAIQSTIQEKSIIKDRSDTTACDIAVEDNSVSCLNQISAKQNLSLSNYALTPESDVHQFYINKQNLCRLLDSDYDLTPERDSNFDKYHHLLNEVSANVPDIKLNGLEKNPNLLITEHYAIGQRPNSRNENFFRTTTLCNIDSRVFLNEEIKKKIITRVKQSVSLDDYEIDSKSEGEIQKVTSKTGS